MAEKKAGIFSAWQGVGTRGAKERGHVAAEHKWSVDECEATASARFVAPGVRLMTVTPGWLRSSVEKARRSANNSFRVGIA